MKITVLFITAGIVGIAAMSGLLSASGAIPSYEVGEYKRVGWSEKSALVAAADNPLYLDECGACHLAYPPGLLPAQDWSRIMDNLDNHFGDDASLDAESTSLIRTYVLEHAASPNAGGHAKAFAAGDPSTESLPRITQTRYFKREHHEIPKKWVTENADVGSFSNCNACHKDADKGIFDEDRVIIPNLGRWDD